MIGMALGAILFLCHLSSPATAEEEKKKPQVQADTPDDDAFADEFPDEEEADFPDLVGADETGGFMDELLFLEEAGTVELPARHAQAIGMSPSAITVITREDIEASGANRLSDLFRMVPGLDINYVSTLITSVTGRLVWGYTNNTFLGLIDGREINVELLGQPFWDVQAIAVEDIERIEVLRGPGSSLYGANAMAGVISITTRQIAEEPSGSVRLTAGQPGTVILDGNASFRVGNWGFSLAGGLDQATSFAAAGTAAKDVCKLRSVASYRWSDTESLTLDASLSDVAGPVSTAVTDINIEALFAQVRLAYKSESLEGQLSWSTFDVFALEKIPLDYAGLHLAYFPEDNYWAHIFDSKIQWTAPEFWEPLLIITGGRVRASRVVIVRGLDAETYLDPNSPGYLKEGQLDWEVRAGAFMHVEFAPFDWFTLTAGGRWDYNNVTGMILSPRLTGVFKPGDGHFLRAGYAQSFRMPSYHETTIHFGVDFPDDSPFQSDSQKAAFREFATRIMGNADLREEVLKALELGYRGEFLDGRLSLSVDLYCNFFQDQVILYSNIALDTTGMPDLRNSSAQFENFPEQDRTILGGEILLRYHPTKNYTLVASWSHREVFYTESDLFDDGSPKNYLTLGGRFLTDWGLVGSLFLFTRSEFTDFFVANPKGIMEPYQVFSMPRLALLMGRLGLRWNYDRSITMEAGFKFLLPFVLTGDDDRYFEKSGGETVFGQHYGSDEMRQAVSGYLQGAF